MADSGMARFIAGMQRRGRRDIAEHLALLRIGLPAAGGMVAAVTYATVGGVGGYYETGAAGYILSAAAGALACGAIGHWFARRSEDSIPGLRTAVRERLLDGGLLRLALEPDPYERLPSLRPLRPALFGRTGQAEEHEPLQTRLARFVQYYQHLSAEAGLLPGTPQAPLPPPRQLSLLTAPQLQLRYAAGFALLSLPVLLNFSFGPGFFLLEVLARLILFLAGAALIYPGPRREHPGAPPFGQSALETAALRLELAELLRGTPELDSQ